MPAKSKLYCAGISDTGRARRENEDRIHVDPDRGIFIVADGLGGHAAGERAAETAIQMIVARLQRQTGSTEERVREAMAVANNEILALANKNPEWKGMASVVTLAVVEDDQVTVGHVGDSRLYLLEPGTIRKMTSDHSPVGELEDAGQLSESAAMAHPRRNEVFRDLGSEQRGPHDDEFIEIVRFRLRPNGALLLCSDGLTDLVPAERIRAIVESHPRDPEAAALALVRAANDAGGKDNVSVVLVEGPLYGPLRTASAPVSTPVPAATGSQPRTVSPILALAAGILLMTVLFAIVRPYVVQTAEGIRIGHGTVRGPITLRVGQGAYPSIAAALADANPGDTVSVGPGQYREPVRLKSGVALVNVPRRTATLESADVVVDADGVERARLAGFRIVGPGRMGLRIVNSDIEVIDLEVSGMQETGIEITGESSGVVMASAVVRNAGGGIVVHAGARPVIAHNSILGNGAVAGAPRPGIYVSGSASPEIVGNLIAENGVEQIWVSPLFNAGALVSSNTISPGIKDRTKLVKVVTR